MTSPHHQCSLCNITCRTVEGFNAHLKGHKHSEHIRTRISLDVTSIRCTVCNRHVFGERSGWEDHCRTRQHKGNASKVAGYSQPDYDACPTIRVSTITLQCNPCNLSVTENRWGSHVQTQKHFENVSRNLSTHTQVPTQPSPVSHSPPIPPPVQLTPSTSTTSPSHLPLNPQFKRCELCDVETRPPGWDRHLQGSRHQRALAAQASTQTKPVQPSRSASPCALPSNPESRVRTPHSPPHVFWRGGKRNRNEVVIPGIPPAQNSHIPWTTNPEEYPIPEHFEKEVPRAILSNLSTTTYTEAWKKFMLAEEVHMRENLKNFDVHNIPLEKHGSYYHVAITGLEDWCPPVETGDSIGVRLTSAPPNDPWFEGFIHYVHGQEVGVRFSRDFKHQNGNLYSVRFELNRTNIRRMYQALFAALDEDYSKKIIFPQPDDFSELPSMADLDNCIKIMKPQIADKSILENPRQLLAVAAIKMRPPGSPPLIIWGPPGTGKTVTGAEGVRQLLLKDPNARILACAPSDSAADAIAENLLDLSVDVLFRLNAPSRPVDKLPAVLIPHTTVIQLRSKYPPDSEFFNTTKTPYEVFSYPPKDGLMKYRVVVSTCSQSETLSGIGIPRGHFTHILVDEAAQALEPEVMIAIKTIANSRTNIILCGDHKQLRPTVFSPTAKRLGYGQSYLERLVASPGYNVITKRVGLSMVRLNQNFRSHPSIIEFPSRNVYDSEIRTCGPPDIINALQDWTGLPKPDFLVIFHAIKATTLQDETDTVKHYVHLLQSSTNLSALDIGIISPNQAQCQSIRNLLYSGDLSKEICKIGTVEEFQGDERKVIVMSTGKSGRAAATNSGASQAFGSIVQENRLNVAITRAMALLIVIGDPLVLAADPLWRIFLDFVRAKGGWCGADVGWDPIQGDEEGR